MGTVKADDFQNSAGTGAPKFSKGIDLSQAAGFTKRKISSITSNTTLTSTDGLEIILADATSGAITVTLPAAASSSGRTLTIKKTDSSVNLVTVDGNASETIDGDLTKKIGFQYDFMQISCDGSNWHIVDENRKVMCNAIGKGGSALAIAKATYTTLTTFTLTNDPFGMFTNSGQIVIKETGWYEYSLECEVEEFISGSGPTVINRYLTIAINNSASCQIFNSYKTGDTGANYHVLPINFKKYLTSGDTLEVRVYIDHTGGSVTGRQSDPASLNNRINVFKI